MLRLRYASAAGYGIAARLLTDTTILVVGVGFLDKCHTLYGFSEPKLDGGFKPTFTQLKMTDSKGKEICEELKPRYRQLTVGLGVFGLNRPFKVRTEALQTGFQDHGEDTSEMGFGNVCNVVGNGPGNSSSGQEFDSEWCGETIVVEFKSHGRYQHQQLHLITDFASWRWTYRLGFRARLHANWYTVLNFGNSVSNSATGDHTIQILSTTNSTSAAANVLSVRMARLSGQPCQNLVAARFVLQQL
ncbi:hypothetical protein DFH07DRAFT_770025 [Mycena maculata]|uniref:Uncharacterized protein n=1 Tax=Mycena maculata TaxID=230809 RepID=A0AAD7NM26_9AGAR|nr:hypothetical protein DFH07DRAFT_770025 [Mycena maculata]